MDDLLKFVDNNIIEKQLYWHIPELYTSDLDDMFEIQWKNNREFPWRYKKRKTLFWKQVKTENLINVLNNEKVDLAIFEANLRNSILQQAVYANKLFKDINGLMGEDTVKKAIEDNEDFLLRLKEAIESVINKKGSPDQSSEEESKKMNSSFTVHKSKPDVVATSRKHLRLLSDEPSSPC